MNKSFPEYIATEINAFCKAVTSKISVKKIILFGSWTKDLGCHWSDIDVAVIADQFDTMECLERVCLLLNIAEISGCNKIDPHGFTSLELSENNSRFINEVINGIEIYHINEIHGE